MKCSLCYKRNEMLLGLASLLDIATSSSVVFTNLGGLKMFGEKNPGKCKIYIGIAVMLGLCPVFHFHQI